MITHETVLQGEMQVCVYYDLCLQMAELARTFPVENPQLRPMPWVICCCPYDTFLTYGCIDYLTLSNQCNKFLIKFFLWI
jgi:hypothetical protein